MSERNIFLLQPFEHQQICKHILNTVIVINNPTVQIVDPGK